MEKYQRTLEMRAVSVNRTQGLLIVLNPLYGLGHLDMISTDYCISTGRALCPRKKKIKTFQDCRIDKRLGDLYLEDAEEAFVIACFLF